jgi:predicted nucleic acid-binding Zn ribbon protein
MQAMAPLQFRCPECAESVTVNEEMKDAMLEKGCIICGAALSATDFTER